jgi:DDE superfamily endonuclease
MPPDQHVPATEPHPSSVGSGCAAMPMATFSLVRLGAFRAALHACCTRRADALFEVGDALLCTQAVASLPHLSLAPVCRGGWGSAYAALARGRIDEARLRELLAGSLQPAHPLVFAVDVTTWPRCDAECSARARLSTTTPRQSAGQPIIAGWAFQWITQLSVDRDSWTTPGGRRRLHPLDDTDRTAAVQSGRRLGGYPPTGRCRCRRRWRLRLRPAVPRPRRRCSGGAGTAARRPLRRP